MIRRVYKKTNSLKSSEVSKQATRSGFVLYGIVFCGDQMSDWPMITFPVSKALNVSFHLNKTT